MAGRSSRVKGQIGEREFFELSNEALKDVEWPYRRKDGRVFFRHPAPRHGAGQPDNSDVLGVLPVSIEVKFVKEPEFTRWINKLREQQADGSIRPHQTPVLAWRANHQPWTAFVMMSEAEWKEYLKWRLENANRR